MLFLFKFLLQFIIANFIIFPLYFLIISFKLKPNKRPINAPELIPFLGNIHLIISTQIYHKVWSVFLKYSSPLRIKCLTYESVFIDSPEDIRKILAANKSDIYEVVPYNNGLFSIKGKNYLIVKVKVFKGIKFKFRNCYGWIYLIGIK